MSDATTVRMNRTRTQVTIRVSETVAWAALDALVDGTCESQPLYYEAAGLAMEVGATFDGYEVELDPHGIAMRNRVDLFFTSTAKQHRQIIDGLVRRGFDVVTATPKWGRV